MANSKIVKLFKTANHHSYLPLDAFPTSGGKVCQRLDLWRKKYNDVVLSDKRKRRI